MGEKLGDVATDSIPSKQNSLWKNNKRRKHQVWLTVGVFPRSKEPRCSTGCKAKEISRGQIVDSFESYSVDFELFS